MPTSILPSLTRILLLLTSTLSLTLAPISLAVDVDVDIPDPVLEALIREKIIKYEGTLTDTDLRSFTSLESVLHEAEESEQIKSLEGLQYATNLNSFDFSGHAFTDVTPISAITNLKSLHIANNPFFDPAPLEALARLHTLTLVNTDLSSLAFAANLQALTHLTLSQNNIDSLAPLETLSQLQSLQISNNSIQSITPIQSLPNLATLNIRQNLITDLSPIANLDTLTDLDISSNPLASLQALASLSQLQNLTANFLEGRDFSSIAQLTNLSYLALRYNQIEDLSFLSSLTNLTRIEIDNNRIVDPSPLAALTNLDYLQIYSNFITDISSLETLTPTDGVALQNNFIDFSQGAPSVETIVHWRDNNGIDVGILDQFEAFFDAIPSFEFLAADGDTGTIDTIANYPWTATVDAPWLSLSQTSGFDATSIQIKAQPNGTNAPRNATIDFGFTQIAVIQRHHEDYFTFLLFEGISPNDESYWPLRDKDGDGSNNFFEWVADLDLEDPNSKFEYTLEPHPTTSSQRRIKVSKRPDGSDYAIDYTSTFDDWTNFDLIASEDISDENYRYLTFPNTFDDPILVRVRIAKD